MKIYFPYQKTLTKNTAKNLLANDVDYWEVCSGELIAINEDAETATATAVKKVYDAAVAGDYREETITYTVPVADMCSSQSAALSLCKFRNRNKDNNIYSRATSDIAILQSFIQGRDLSSLTTKTGLTGYITQVANPSGLYLCTASLTALYMGNVKTYDADDATKNSIDLGGSVINGTTIYPTKKDAEKAACEANKDLVGLMKGTIMELKKIV